MRVQLAEIHQCLAHPDRLRIVAVLAENALSVQELQAVLQLSQVEVSKHLAYLRGRGIVSAIKAGTRRIYQCGPDLRFEVAGQLRCLRECVAQRKLFQDEFARIRALPRKAALRKRRGTFKALQSEHSERGGLDALAEHLL